MCLGWVLSVVGGPGEAVDRPLTALPGPKRSVKTATRPRSTRVEFQRLSMISGRRACHPIRHLTHQAGPPRRKDLLTKLSCATESYCAGFLGLATFKTEFWPFQRLSMISGGKGVEMYTLLVFGNPFPETRVVTPSTQPTGAPLAPGSVCSGRSRRKP